MGTVAERLFTGGAGNGLCQAPDLPPPCPAPAHRVLGYPRLSQTYAEPLDNAVRVFLVVTLLERIGQQRSKPTCRGLSDVLQLVRPPVSSWSRRDPCRCPPRSLPRPPPPPVVVRVCGTHRPQCTPCSSPTHPPLAPQRAPCNHRSSPNSREQMPQAGDMH